MTTFLIADASTAKAPKVHSMHLTTDVAKVAKTIEDSISKVTKQKLVFIAVNDTLVPLKSAAFDVLHNSELLDKLNPELFDSFVIQDWFKRSVCERVRRLSQPTKPKPF